MNSCRFCNNEMIDSCIVINDIQALSAAFNTNYKNSIYCENCNYYVLNNSMQYIVLNSQAYIEWNPESTMYQINYSKKSYNITDTINNPGEAHKVLKKTNNMLMLV